MTAPVLMSVRCPISKLPVPHASSSRRQQLCAGGFAALGTLEQPFELCRALGGFAKSGLGDGQTPPWADTCAVEVCKVPDTLGGSDLFFFQLLTQPDRSSLRVFRFGRANKIPLHCEISGSVPAHPPLLSLWHCPTLGNYWHCVGHIKFPIKQCVAISLLQPPLLLLCNRSSSGISSSFHSHLLISSDIFQGWFLYCFRDMFLASSFCLLLETEHTWVSEMWQICTPLFASTSASLPVFSLDINDPEHELICVNGVTQQRCNVHFNLQWNLLYQLRPMGLEF